jgi:transcriptional regulator with XRE-family HTH domain
LDPTIAFGHVLHTLRKEAGLTQEQLSFKAAIEQNFISLIERGINQPTIRALFQLASAFGTSLSALLFQVEQELQNNA